MQQAAVGMSDDIAIEVHVYFGGAKHYRINHGRETRLTVVIVGGKRRCGHVARVSGDRLHCVEIERLSIEDVIGQAFLQHFDEVAG